MKRHVMTVAAAALIPALALAESPSAETAVEPMPMEQAQPADPAHDNLPSDLARTESDAVAPQDEMIFDGQVRLSSISGAAIYTLSAEVEADWTGSVQYVEIAEDWERIGSVEDVVLSADGRIMGVVAEVGGFLGIGDKMVMLPVDEMRLVRVDETAFAVVTPFTSDDLAEMAEFEDRLAY